MSQRKLSRYTLKLFGFHYAVPLHVPLVVSSKEGIHILTHFSISCITVIVSRLLRQGDLCQTPMVSVLFLLKNLPKLVQV